MDVTGWRGGLTVALLVLLAVMFVGIFWPSPHKPKILHLVIAGTVVTVTYLSSTIL